MTDLTAQQRTAATPPTSELPGEARIHNAVSATVENILRRNDIPPAEVARGVHNALIEAMFHVPEAERAALVDQMQAALSRVIPSSAPIAAPVRK